MLKKGADVWLNNPYMYREASGTSGMTAAMNGAVNLSIPDGWIPEFAKDNVNCFVIAKAADSLASDETNRQENNHLMSTLVDSALPIYYTDHHNWIAMVKRGVNDVLPNFESGRMAQEYYAKLYRQQ